MVLVDTSVWIDFLRDGDEALAQLLTNGSVCIHPMVIGELACGNLSNRKQLMELWQNLPTVSQASYSETMFFLEAQQLMGKGIGFVDLHLLTAVRLSSNTLLWTRDKRLGKLAHDLGCGYVSH